MQDIGQLLINLRDAFEGFKNLINPSGGVGLAYLTGLGLVAMALFRAYRMSNDRFNVTVNQVVSPLVIGGMFLAWSNTTQMVSESMALSGGALGYKVPAGSSYSQHVVDAVLVGVSLFGTLAVFRGLLKWKAAGEGSHHGGDDPVWSGLWHIVGGAIGMNISGFLIMLGF